MDSIRLPPAMILVWDVKRAIEKNQSLHLGIKNFVNRNLKDSFSSQFKSWYESSKSNPQLRLQDPKFSSAQKIVCDLLFKGLAGIPIYESLTELNAFMISSCEDDIEKHILLLPLLMQIPLLGLLFPAILMVLLVPALSLLKI